MYLPFIEEIADYIFMEGKAQKSDIIFVPGNGYPQMAEKAAGLWREGYAPYILPSGKYSKTVGKFAGVLDEREKYPGDFSTEWEFLREVLLKNGVAESAILREDQATYTEENAYYSRKVIKEQKISVKKALLCCKNYHARRAFLYYKKHFPDTEIQVIPVCADVITRENWKQTEEGVKAVTGEVSRIIYQFSLLEKDS